MLSKNNDSKKIVLGLVIGSAIGAGILYSVKAAYSRKPSLAQKIGKTIAEVGEKIEQCNFDTCSDLMHKVEKKIPYSKDLVDTTLDCISLGVNLINKLKKGR